MIRPRVVRLKNMHGYTFAIANRTNGSTWCAEDKEAALSFVRLLMEDFRVRHNLPLGALDKTFATDILITEHESFLAIEQRGKRLRQWYAIDFLSGHPG